MPNRYASAEQYELFYSNIWWVLLIALAIGLFVFRRYMLDMVEDRPELRRDYDLLFPKLSFLLTFPWPLMGAGILTGIAKVEYFIFPTFRNVYATLWQLLVYGAFFLAVKWVFTGNNAEKIANFGPAIKKAAPGRIGNMPVPSHIKITPSMVKLVTAIATAFVVILLGIMTLLGLFR